MFQTQLQHKIEESGGAIDLATYMALCNAHYYNSRDPLGQGGDFTTAPEISQMFGELISIWLADLWIKSGQPDLTLLECGPGRGTLMADILRGTKHVPGFHEAFDIALLENSETLKDQQEQNIQHQSVSWISSIEELKNINKPLFCIGNEFLDALPVQQYVLVSNTWKKRCITLNENNELSFILLDDVQPQNLPVQHAEKGDIWEESHTVCDFIRKLSGLIHQNGGACLFIDYGHTATAYGETLQAVKNHKYHDPLKDPGDADLTAHVNFQQVEKDLQDAKLHTHGPNTQSAFLQGLGLEMRAQKLKEKATDKQALKLDQDVARLISPDEMGRLFKVIAATSDPTLTPAGFA